MIVDQGVEVWRGSVAAWECDTMGHLNVGFYAAKAAEALVGLAAELGMPHAFAPHAEATLIVREQHIRFLREAHVGAKLSIDAGVLEMGEDDARLLFLMRHDDGQLAATFQMRVAHATAREGRAFPWPEWARARAEALRIAAPEKAAPRSIPLDPVESRASLPRALELGLKRTGLGAIRTAEADPFGRMRPETLMARLSDCVTHVMSDLLKAVGGERVGAVMLEYRLLFLEWPRIGDRFEIRSGFSGAEPRLQRLNHWCLDPQTGRPWAATESVSAAFDIEQRKMITLSEDELPAWRAFVTPGLSI
jgi:acyl-CoA thioester hydrolase